MRNILKGKIFHHVDGWFVVYQEKKEDTEVKNKEVPLHPEDVKHNERFFNKIYKHGDIVDIYLKMDCDVECCGMCGTCNKGKIYAKIGHKEPYVSDNFQIGPDGAYEHISWGDIYETAKEFSLMEENEKDQQIAQRYFRLGATWLKDQIYFQDKKNDENGI